MKKWLVHLNHRAKKAGVTFEFGKEATAEAVREFAPEAVIVATGARPLVPPIKGTGFHQNIQYMTDEFEGLTIAFPDTRITSAPLGFMVESVFQWSEQGDDFQSILDKLTEQIENTSAFIMVDDLDHLVKGGRLSNGAAILGNLLSIKPILYFNDQGVIEVYEKVRTEKKATKRLVEIVKEVTANGNYQITVIHGNASQKAADLLQLLLDGGVATDISIATFGSVIGTHLGEGSIALGYTPIV